jgi:hypothetical protein
LGWNLSRNCDCTLSLAHFLKKRPKEAGDASDFANEWIVEPESRATFSVKRPRHDERVVL